MKVYSDHLPDEMEFLQAGILVRWNFVEKQKNEDGGKKHTFYEFNMVKIELNDTSDIIKAKLLDAGYNGDLIKFSKKIIKFRG